MDNTQSSKDGSMLTGLAVGILEDQQLDMSLLSTTLQFPGRVFDNRSFRCHLPKLNISMYLMLAKHLMWIRRLFWEVQYKSPFKAYEVGRVIPCTKMHIDNTAALTIATNDQVSARNKHIELKAYHIRQEPQLGHVA